LEPTADAQVALSPHHYSSTHFGDTETLEHFIATYPDHKFILNIRDLRDVALSMLDWCLELEGASFTHSIDITTWNALPRKSQLASQFSPKIWGDSWLIEEYRDFMNFIAKVPSDRILITSFEKLVGSRGGGNDLDQQEEIRKIADFLSVSYEELDIQEIADHLYGETFTFRVGQIKRWEKEYDASLLDLFKTTFGDFLVEFGYESSL
jgi:hypothetical protein